MPLCLIFVLSAFKASSVKAAPLCCTARVLTFEKASVHWIIRFYLNGTVLPCVWYDESTRELMQLTEKRQDLHLVRTQNKKYISGVFYSASMLSQITSHLSASVGIGQPFDYNFPNSGNRRGLSTVRFRDRDKIHEKTDQDSY